MMITIFNPIRSLDERMISALENNLNPKFKLFKKELKNNLLIFDCDFQDQHLACDIATGLLYKNIMECRAIVFNVEVEEESTRVRIK